jgi:hypothetical protein
MNIQPDMRASLELHLSRKVENNQWLTQVLDGHDAAFPYRPLEGGEGRVAFGEYRSAHSIDFFPQTDDEPNPIYHVNVPLAHLPGNDGDNRLSVLLRIFQDEAFGATPAQSLGEARRRLSLVVGINQIRSLDPELNRSFISFIERIQHVETFAVRVFGFFWAVQWAPLNPLSSLYTYPVDKAFLLVKVLDTHRAQSVREIFEMNGMHLNPGILSQIPFQRIRERIKSSMVSKSLMSHIFEHAVPTAPIYYAVMDGDCQHLRTNVGLFSRMDGVIRSRLVPSAISLGYRVADDERPLIRLGVELDMKVREAMTAAIPFSAYLPEPCSIFCIRSVTKVVPLEALSFLGGGHCLENRRLIQNAMAQNLFDRSVVFCSDGGVTTGTPSRMKTQKNAKVLALTPAILKKKSSLQSLRGISQSHAFPKQWADNLYIALGLQGFSSPRVTDVTQRLMQLLGVYDPINRMFSYPSRFSRNVFDSVMTGYHQPLSEPLVNMRSVVFVALQQLGMSPALIERVDEAARNSGEAIFQVLHRETL